MNQDVDLPSGKQIQRQLQAHFGDDLLAHRPRQLVLFPLIVAAIAAGTSAVLRFDFSVWTNLAFAFVLASLYGAAIFLTHELMHGSITRNVRLQNAFAYCGLTLFLISPTLWRVWHNKNHHGHTNAGNRDPDSFGTIDRYQRMRSTRFVTRLAPGSRSWMSYFFFFYWFTFHGQVVLWMQSRLLHDFRDVNRKRAILDSALMLAFWVTLGYVAGPYKSLFVIVLPMLLGNLTIMSYIATNHFLMPQGSHPLQNSMGVRTHPIVDLLHFNFSHHIEHHLLPSMNWRNYPKVRRWLETRFPAQYTAPSHALAIRLLYSTPRIYRDKVTLCDPRLRQPDVATDDLGKFMLAMAGLGTPAPKR